MTEAAACEWAISIHAPRAGSDTNQTTSNTDDDEFQSTLPVRGATYMAKVGKR